MKEIREKTKEKEMEAVRDASFIVAKKSHPIFFPSLSFLFFFI